MQLPCLPFVPSPDLLLSDMQWDSIKNSLAKQAQEGDDLED